MLYWFIDQIMFDILRRLRRPKHSCWIFVMTDEYLMGYHATDRYERVLTTGCTFDGLNKLEGWKRWKTGTLKNGFVASLEDLRSCITGFLDEYALDKCYKRTATVIFPKAINPDHMRYVVLVFKELGFKEVNVYNPEIEISLPSKRMMTSEERAEFVKRLELADLNDDAPLCWNGLSYDLLAKEDLHYSSLGCMYCGSVTVEIDYAPGEIFPNARGVGRVHVCSNCLRQQRHKKIGRI